VNETNRGIAVIHFQPLELFPPVMNLLNFLGTTSKEKIIAISTLKRKETNLKNYRNGSGNIEIKRTPPVFPHSVFRIFNYLFFYCYALYFLFKKKPAAVLYFETISSWPALLYKKIRKNKGSLLVHYHEYTTPDEYVHNMRLVKWMHKLETKMYSTSYNWISHTNGVRLNKFKSDHSLQNADPAMFHIMPNYPSEFWAAKITKFGSGTKTRLVYAGALGYDTMYLQETIDWVIVNKEFLSLDLYAYNIDAKSLELLNSVTDDSINFLGGCNYEDLPGILANYDVGLVLYKPYAENMIYNISNKVFEYLACGLDVWFSKDMTYSVSLARNHVYPKIIPVDFKNLNDFDFKSSLQREGLEYKPSEYYCEKLYEEINIISAFQHDK